MVLPNLIHESELDMHFGETVDPDALAHDNEEMALRRAMLDAREAELDRMEEEMVARMDEYMERIAEVEQREEDVSRREAKLNPPPVESAG